MTATKPPTEPSEEAGRVGLALARSEGAAYGLALKHMTGIVAKFGASKEAGDYQIALALEKAEGLYFWTGSGLEWREPVSENLHVEVAVRDASDGRFIPGLEIHAHITDAAGSEIASLQVPFLWHPTLYHYGQNVKAPASTKVFVTVRVEPPTFPRHDKINGQRYTQPAEVRFGPIDLGFLAKE